MAGEETNDRPLRLDAKLPGAIHTIQNVIWGDITLRDAMAAAGVLIVAMIVSRLVPGIPLQVAVFAIIAAPGLVLALYHLVSDAPPIEVTIKRYWNRYRYAPELTWKKETADDGTPIGDSTQGMFPNFTIDAHGFLLYDDGGGAALIKVSGSDYDMRRGAEQEALVYSWMTFLDGLSEGEGIPIEIITKSMPLDLSTEVDAAEARLRALPEDSAIRTAMENYIAFLEWMQDPDENAVHEMKYYIVVPYLANREGFGRKTLGVGPGLTGERMKSNNPLSRWLRKRELARDDLGLNSNAPDFSASSTVTVLTSRTDKVLSLLSGIQGLTCELAKQEEYVELLYYFFNPASSKMKYVLDAGVRQHLASFSPEMSELRRLATPVPEPRRPASIMGTGSGAVDLSSLLGGKK